MITGLRRSCIYVPGDSTRMLAGSAGLAADALMLNLEDGVAASVKDAARQNVVEALRTLDFGSRERIVRINALQTATGMKDMEAVVPARPDGLCLAKVESAADIVAADSAMGDLERRHGIPEGSLKLHAMIESSRGVLRAAEIAAACGRMASLLFGSADYSKDVGCQPGEERTELLFAMQAILTAARAAGIDAVDAPCFDIRNADRLHREALQARRFGFDGKSALHPGQLQIIHDIFSVSQEEIAWARRVLQALQEAEQRGKSLAMMDGQLVDDPHRKAAQRILRRAGSSS